MGALMLGVCSCVESSKKYRVSIPIDYLYNAGSWNNRFYIAA